jgi:hypothetical protein
MANKFINPNDITYTVVAEEAFGVLDADGVRYELPVKADQGPPTFTANEIASDTKRLNRENNGSQRGMESGEWTAEMRAIGAPVMDLMIQSATSGRFDNAGKLIASDNDLSFTILSLLRKGIDGTADSALMYEDRGCMVNSFSFDAKFGEAANFSFGVLATNRDKRKNNSDLVVVGVPNTSVELRGAQIKNVSIAGATALSYSDIAFETTQERAIRGVLGSDQGVDIETSGSRSTKLTLKAYRESFDVDAAMTGLPQAVSFTVGTAGNGYKFIMPAAIAQFPSDELAGGSLLVNLVFTPKYDNTTGAGLIIERL